MNCQRKTIPKECVEAILDKASLYYLRPTDWCTGCRNEFWLERNQLDAPIKILTQLKEEIDGE